jgi:hypothetical protein
MTQSVLAVEELSGNTHLPEKSGAGLNVHMKVALKSW